MDAFDVVLKPLKEFAKSSHRLLNKCSKPDRREFTKVCIKTGIGFLVTGFIGFFVKLVFIPINQIIVGA